MRACARDIGRIPSVRDYIDWREDRLGGRPGKRAGATDIPHYRTYYRNYGSWGDALEDAGIDPAYRARIQTTDYTSIEGLTA